MKMLVKFFIIRIFRLSWLNVLSFMVGALRSQETLKSSHLKNVFFHLHIVETSFGDAYTKF